MACTRPGGTVWRVVESSPWRTRRPSGESLTVNDHMLLIRCQTAWPMTMANQRKTARPIPVVARWPFWWPTTVSTGPMRRNTRRHEAISRSTAPISRPWGTESRIRSGASASPWPAPVERPSMSARRTRATGRDR